MHGRLKVRTSAEQEERKRLEREKKLKAYKTAMSACVAKQLARDYDKSGLALSGEILAGNCDVQTLWNFRKQIIEAAVAVASSIPADSVPATTDDNKPPIVDLFENELALTETCLRKNPKSYGSWFHRQWCLKKADGLDLTSKSVLLSWSNELKLCGLFLKMDERNFHCWRHRFFVVENGTFTFLDS